MYLWLSVNIVSVVTILSVWYSSPSLSSAVVAGCGLLPWLCAIIEEIAGVGEAKEEWVGGVLNNAVEVVTMVASLILVSLSSGIQYIVVLIHTTQMYCIQTL